MPILKYTTQIDADKTAGEIAKMLSMHGAKAVLTEYDESENYVKSLSFKIKIGENDVVFRMPTDWKPILPLLEANPKVPKRLVTQEQAIRVAWRILHHWVEAQMAFIEAKQVKSEQVFLAYAVTRNGKTLGENILENPQLLLGGGELKK